MLGFLWQWLGLAWRPGIILSDAHVLVKRALMLHQIENRSQLASFHMCQPLLQTTQLNLNACLFFFFKCCIVVHKGSYGSHFDNICCTFPALKRNIWLCVLYLLSVIKHVAR